MKNIGQYLGAGVLALATGCMTPPQYSNTNVLPISERKEKFEVIPRYTLSEAKVGDDQYKFLSAPEHNRAEIDGRLRTIIASTYAVPTIGSREIILDGKRTTNHEDNYFLVGVEPGENNQIKMSQEDLPKPTRTKFYEADIELNTLKESEHTAQVLMQRLLQKIPVQTVGKNGRSFFVLNMSKDYLKDVEDSFETGMLSKVYMDTTTTKPVTEIEYLGGNKAKVTLSLQGEQYMLKKGKLVAEEPTQPQPTPIPTKPQLDATKTLPVAE